MVRILALDDDNHEVMYATENGRTFGYARDLIQFLASPHTEEYEVRGFTLINYEGEAGKLPEELIDQMFYCVEGYGREPKGYSRRECFETLWASSEEDWR